MLDITPNFAEERPGAVRALREVQGIPSLPSWVTTG
jgi:hypothetical protein